MKILRSNNRKKSILYALAIVTLLGLITLAFAYAFNTYPFNKSQSSTNLNPATTDQKEAGEEIKRSNNTNSPTNSAKNDSDQTAPSTPNPGTTGKQNIPVTITSTNQDVDGNLNIRAIVNTIENDNTCTLLITRENQELYTETVNTFAQSSYTSCGGFSVEKAKLNGITGNINVTVTYNGPSYTGTTSKEVTLK